MTMLHARRWRLPLILALSAALAGVLLVGVSSWFLGAVALAGLGPAAYTFGFHHPAALVRFLAVFRTATKYGERVTGHGAALSDQTEHRGRLFRRMAGSPETRRGGWQLARADRLESFLGDVERVDFARLRVSLPALSAAGCTLVVSALTFVAVPLALPVVLSQGVLILVSAVALAKLGHNRAEKGKALRRVAAEGLGQKLAGLVSLEGSGERPDRIAESMSLSLDAEAEAAAARLRLGAADALLSALGPVAAALTLIVAAATGPGGEALLPAVLAAFSWLALGEVCAPLARAGFARFEADAAEAGLSGWADDDAKAASTRCTELDVTGLPLRNPCGVPVGGTVSFSASPGRPAALLGPSGCGKTTLLKALAGWIPFTDGPHPLGCAASARAGVHLSLHDAAILDASFRDNLFSEAADAELWRALEAVEMAARVRAAGGLDARAQQEGLSLGEARRIALARALLTDRPFVFLDEPGEHLDGPQAERILRRLLSALRDRTVVFVTHDSRLADLAATRERLGSR